MKPEAAAALVEDPILVGAPSDRALGDQLLSTAWTPRRALRVGLLVSGAGTLMLFTLLGYTALAGIGVWGNQIPVAWGFGIINFVWWIGIGHAGTFISAVLYLVNQPWRTSINRFAEAMTLFAVLQAALFPLFHLGRPWFAYWLFPYPSTMQVWPNFRSALMWDFAAISTYGTVSLLFWYLGLIPDLASARSTAPRRWLRQVYGFFALGWRGSAQDWARYRVVYGLLAGLATPLVLSVHSIVSLDFAAAKTPGWHATIFPPYFVAGAIFSGFAMVLTLLIPARRLFGLDAVVTPRHLDSMAKMLLVTGSVVAYGYLSEFFMAWYGGNPYEATVLLEFRPFGPYAPIFWLMISCNVILPQLFWSRRLRRSAGFLFIASILINVGMWTERFIIVVSSLSADFLPSSWSVFVPTIVDGGIFFGTISFFLFLFLLFLRFVPFVPVTELREMRHELVHEGRAQAPSREDA